MVFDLGSMLLNQGRICSLLTITVYNFNGIHSIIDENKSS
jgi:hypothetical protein